MGNAPLTDLVTKLLDRRAISALLVSAVLLAAVISFGVSPAAAGTDWESEFEGQLSGEPPIQGADGVTVQQYYTLWQSTPPSVITHYENLLSEYIEAEWSEADSIQPSSDFPQVIYQKTLLVASASNLQPYGDYPSEISNWNFANLNTFTPGDDDTSRRPSGVNTEGNAYVDDAYVDITSLPGSAVHHTYSQSGSSERARLVNPDQGTDVNVVGDYKIDIPDDINSDTTRVEYDLQSHEITEKRVYIDGTEVASSGSDAHFGAFELSSSDIPSGVSEYTVEMDIQVDVEVHKEQVEIFCADSFNGTCNRYSERFVTEFDGVKSQTLTVSDSQSVTPTTLDASDIEVEYLNHPDGYTIAKVDTDGGWLSFTLPGEVYGYGSYRGYSSRNPAWDTVSSDDTEAVSSVHPAVFHIRPSDAGITIPPSQSEYGVKFSNTEGVTVQDRGSVSGSLQGTQMDLSEDQYKSVRDFHFQSEELVFGEGSDSVTFQGYTGEDVTVQAESAGEMKRTEISVTNISRTESTDTAEIEVTLNDSSGAAVQTDGRDGYVEIAGNTVNTGNDGTATVQVPDTTDVFVVNYVPGSPWNPGTSYVESGVTGEVPSEPIPLIQYINSLIPAAALLSFVYLGFKLVSKGITGG